LRSQAKIVVKAAKERRSHKVSKSNARAREAARHVTLNNVITKRQSGRLCASPVLRLSVMSSGEAPSATGTSLLIVDDDVLVLRMTKKLLERRGYSVVACSSGDEALAWLARRTFDCMISDVQMPGITGTRLLRAVRDRDLDLPVVFITGNPDVETAATAIEYGALH